MFSWEIDNLIKAYNYYLPSSEYEKITDLKNNPQIRRIYYDAFENKFYIETEDGYNWTIRVYKKEGESF